MQSPQAKLKDIQRLLGVYPPVNSDDPEQVVRNYLFAVDDHAAQDVTTAVDAFLKGSVPGTNAAFLPSAPVLAAEVRRQMNLRLDREYRERLSKPALPKPDIERTPESQARVRELMERAVHGLKRMSEEDDPVERHRAQMRRANEYFDAERGYSIGDPEDAADAA